MVPLEAVALASIDCLAYCAERQLLAISNNASHHVFTTALPATAPQEPRWQTHSLGPRLVQGLAFAERGQLAVASVTSTTSDSSDAAALLFPEATKRYSELELCWLPLDQAERQPVGAGAIPNAPTGMPATGTRTPTSAASTRAEKADQAEEDEPEAAPFQLRLPGRDPVVALNRPGPAVEMLAEERGPARSGASDGGVAALQAQMRRMEQRLEAQVKAVEDRLQSRLDRLEELLLLTLTQQSKTK
jgi:hypothetical protein